jgi:hypothetical protein
MHNPYNSRLTDRVTGWLKVKRKNGITAHSQQEIVSSIHVGNGILYWARAIKTNGYHCAPLATRPSLVSGQRIISSGWAGSTVCSRCPNRSV